MKHSPEQPIQKGSPQQPAPDRHEPPLHCCLPSVDPSAVKAATPPAATPSPRQPRRLSGFGFLLALLVVSGLLAANASILWSTQTRVTAEQRTATEAAKPVEASVTVLTAPTCTTCYNVERLTAALRSNSRVKVTKEESVNYESAEGKALVTSSKISRVPAVVIRGAIPKLLTVAEFLKSFGQASGDGTSFVASNLPAPYLEIESGKIRGNFTATLLTDTQCQECYNPALHRSALSGIGLTPSEERTVDRADAEGKKLIEQYAVESTPTLLLSGDLGVYQTLQQVWPSVGTIEADGTYVFRQGQPQMGSYYDLKTKKVVKAEPAENATPPSAGNEPPKS